MGQRAKLLLAMLASYKGMLVYIVITVLLTQLPATVPGKVTADDPGTQTPSIQESGIDFLVPGLGLPQK